MRARARWMKMYEVTFMSLRAPACIAAAYFKMVSKNVREGGWGCNQERDASRLYQSIFAVRREEENTEDIFSMKSLSAARCTSKNFRHFASRLLPISSEKGNPALVLIYRTDRSDRVYTERTLTLRISQPARKRARARARTQSVWTIIISYARLPVFAHRKHNRKTMRMCWASHYSQATCTSIAIIRQTSLQISIAIPLVTLFHFDFDSPTCKLDVSACDVSLRPHAHALLTIIIRKLFLKLRIKIQDQIYTPTLHFVRYKYYIMRWQINFQRWWFLSTRNRQAPIAISCTMKVQDHRKSRRDINHFADWNLSCTFVTL